MHYLIDGYNLIFRLKTDKKSSLEQLRKELILILSQKAAQHQLALIIVFDAARIPPATISRGNFQDLEIVYTAENQTADDYILEYAAAAKNPGELTVVTSDLKLMKQAKVFGVHGFTIEQFLAFLIKKRKKAKPNYIFQEPDRELNRLLAIFQERYEKL